MADGVKFGGDKAKHKDPAATKTSDDKPANPAPTAAETRQPAPQKSASAPTQVRSGMDAPVAAAKVSSGPVSQALYEIKTQVTLPNSQQQVGWRTSVFDQVRGDLMKQWASDPTIKLDEVFRRFPNIRKSDIGPDVDECPTVAPAIQRILDRVDHGQAAKGVQQVSLPTDVQDYVIVGAGLAGVTAGAVMEDAKAAGAGLKGLVIEAGAAKDGVGGRVRDVNVGGLMAGLGASWIHGEPTSKDKKNNNPLWNVATQLGANLVSTNLDSAVVITDAKGQSRMGSATQDKELFAAESKAEGAMGKKAGTDSTDQAASKYYENLGGKLGPFAKVARTESAQGDQGTVGSQNDRLDTSLFSSDDDKFVQQGQQFWVKRLADAAGLPVAFGVRMVSARKDSQGIWTVTMSNGQTVRTKQLIFTGSTGALQDIKWDPPLPQAKVDCIQGPDAALPMGNFTKFLFTTQEPLTNTSIPKNAWVVDIQTDEKGGYVERRQWVANYDGNPNTHIMFTDAQLAQRLLAMNDAQRRQYIEQNFAHLTLGKPVHVTNMAVTPFGDPKNAYGIDSTLFKGCYSSLRAGKEGAHTVMATPENGRSLAGEAVATAQNNGSMAAAYTSGIDAAQNALNALLNQR